MKTPTLSHRFLPATLFLLSVGMRAQLMDPEAPAAAQTPTVETVSGPQIIDSQPPSAKPAAPKLSTKEQELLKRFDKNGDGKLDDSELAMAHEVTHQEELGKAVDNARRLYARLLEKFDTDKKGSLDPKEQADAIAFLEANNKGLYQKLLQKFDRNADAKIDAAESQAMFDTLAQAPKLAAADKEAPSPAAKGPGQGPGGRSLMARRVYERLLTSFDKDHDGALAPAEQADALAYLKEHNPRIYETMLKRYDQDGDGALDPAESQTLFDALAKLPSSAGAAQAPAGGAVVQPSAQEKS